jgi:hypothetical protein
MLESKPLLACHVYASKDEGGREIPPARRRGAMYQRMGCVHAIGPSQLKRLPSGESPWLDRAWGLNNWSWCGLFSWVKLRRRLSERCIGV